MNATKEEYENAIEEMKEQYEHMSEEIRQEFIKRINERCGFSRNFCSAIICIFTKNNFPSKWIFTRNCFFFVEFVVNFHEKNSTMKM